MQRSQYFFQGVCDMIEISTVIRCKHCEKEIVPFYWTFDMVCKCNKALEILGGFRNNPDIILTSGWRCRKYQQELKKKYPETSAVLSPHEFGCAVDFVGKDIQVLKEVFEKLYPELRIGFKSYNGRILHVDNAYELSLSFIKLFAVNYDLPDRLIQEIYQSWKGKARW